VPYEGPRTTAGPIFMPVNEGSPRPHPNPLIFICGLDTTQGAVVLESGGKHFAQRGFSTASLYRHAGCIGEALRYQKNSITRYDYEAPDICRRPITSSRGGEGSTPRSHRPSSAAALAATYISRAAALLRSGSKRGRGVGVAIYDYFGVWERRMAGAGNGPQRPPFQLMLSPVPRACKTRFAGLKNFRVGDVWPTRHFVSVSHRTTEPRISRIPCPMHNPCSTRSARGTRREIRVFSGEGRTAVPRHTQSTITCPRPYSSSRNGLQKGSWFRRGPGRMTMAPGPTAAIINKAHR